MTCIDRTITPDFYTGETIVKSTEYIDEKQFEEYIMNHCSPLTTATLFAIKSIESLFFDESMQILEDLAFNIHFLEKSFTNRVVVFHLPLYCIYRRVGSLSRTASIDRTCYFRKLCRHYIDVLENNNVSQLIKRRSLEYALYVLLPEIKHRYLKSNNWEKAEYKKLIAGLLPFISLLPHRRERMSTGLFLRFPKLYILYSFLRNFIYHEKNNKTYNR